MPTASTKPAPRRRTSTAKPTGNVTYEIEFGGGYGRQSEKIRLTFPASCKVTYGAMHAGNGRMDSGEAVLRIYDGNDKQRAVFRNVVSFRDMSFEMLTLVERVDSSSSARSDEEGVATEARRTVERVWLTQDQLAAEEF